jgi:glycosidase
VSAAIRTTPTGRRLPETGPDELLVDVDTSAAGEAVLEDGMRLEFDGAVLRVDGPDRDLLVAADGRAVTRLRAGVAEVDLTAAVEIRQSGARWSDRLADLERAVADDAERGVRHRYDVHPTAPAVGEVALVRVRTDRPEAIRAVRVEVVEPSPEAVVEAVETEEGVWETTLPARDGPSVVRYRIEVEDERGSVSVVDDAGADFAFPRPGLTFHRPPRSTFSYVVAPPAVPDWFRDGVVYHALVDRFAGPGGAPVDPDGATSLLGFAGGTIAGLTARLDHIAALGATVLLVSPLTPGEMHVCYDVKDHTAVEPRLGTETDVRALLGAAHTRGIRVLLDIEVSYLGMRHPRAKDPGWVLQGPDGQRLGWYGGNPTFVPVDHFHPPARAHLLDALAWWLRLGVDGFRFDSAHATPFDFWSDVAELVRRVRPAAVTIAEATRPIDHCRRYEGRLSGFLDFDAQRALRGFCGDGSAGPSAVAAAFEQQAALPPTLVAAAFFECHDGPRFGLLSAGDDRRVAMATALLMAGPAVPVLYYGTEVGMTQHEEGEMDLLARKPMPWDGHDAARWSMTRELVARRLGAPALRRGAYRTLVADDGRRLLAFERHDHDSGQRIVVQVNGSAEPQDGLGPFEVRIEEVND